MSKHLLSLSDLNAAAPGVLDVVFGPDGNHKDAPNFRGPLRLKDGRYVSMDWLLGQPWDVEIIYKMAFLDLRIPTIASRLLHLLRRLNVQRRATRTVIRVLTDRHISGTWTESDAADLGVVVLALAPQSAVLTETT